MPRYHVPRRPTPPSPADRAAAPQPLKLNFQAFLLPAAATILVLILVAVALLQFLSKSVISVLANDVSDSARTHRQLELETCQARNRQLKPGDFQIDLKFAELAEFVRKAKVLNTLSLMRQCKQAPDPNLPASGIGKLPGTSLEKALELAETQIAKQRQTAGNLPAVTMITLHANEPVPGQPLPDIDRIASKVEALTDNGVVAIIGPTGKLQNSLDTALKNNGNASVCPSANITSCTADAFQQARRLAN